MSECGDTQQCPSIVYFFGTCLTDQLFVNAGLASIRLLQQAGLQVIFPQQQTCCGQPAYNTGFHAQAKSVAARQVKLFKTPYPVIVPSGSCAFMMKHHYPRLFANDPALPRIQEFSARIFEWTEFLVRVLEMKLTDRGLPIRVAWHASCHALRGMGLKTEGKSLLRQLQNVEILSLEREEECCGFGGTFAVKQPAISAAIASDKVADIERSGAQVVLGQDCGCLLNIQGILQQRESQVQVRHIADFLWERINAT